MNPLVYTSWTRWTSIYNLIQLKSFFFFNFLTLIYNPLSHCLVLLCHYHVTLNRNVTMRVSLCQFWTDLWVGCNQGQQMYHNANNLHLWTWWQPCCCWLLQVVKPVRYIKKHQDTLPLWHQGQSEDQYILPFSTCWDALHCPWSPSAHV